MDLRQARDIQPRHVMRLGTTFGKNVPGTIRKRTLVNGRTGERFMEDVVLEEGGPGAGPKANEGKRVLGKEQHEEDPVTALIWQERPGEGARQGRVRLKGIRGWASVMQLVESQGWQSDMAAFILSGEWHTEDSVSG